MAIQTSAGAKLYIGPTTAAADAAAYAALTYVEVGEIEDLGEYGDTVSLANFTALNNRRVRKLKTTYDAGEMQLTMGKDPADAGQTALKAAAASDSDYAFKIVLDDAPAAGTPTTVYFHAAVTGFKTQVGAADNIVKATTTLAINTKIIEVPAA